MITRPENQASIRRREEIFQCSRESSDSESTVVQACAEENCCTPEYDGQFCWPLTLPNVTVRRLCELATDLLYPEESTVSGKQVSRSCVNGEWQVADYAECVYAAYSADQKKLILAQTMLWIYVVVGAISLISLLLAYYVFLRYRSLQCNRIAVHRHFVLSFIIRHTLLLLILYPNFHLLGSIDPFENDKRKMLDEFGRSLLQVPIPSYDELISYFTNGNGNGSSSNDTTGNQGDSARESEAEADSEVDAMDNTTALSNVTSLDEAHRSVDTGSIYLDKFLDSADTYSFLCVVAWMFIEGFYLYYRTVAVFKSEAPFRVFYVIGWGLPALITVLWIVVVEVYEPSPRWGFETKANFRWIIAGPFLVVITVNIIFLVQIIFILARKLRSTRAMEMSQTKKAIRGILLILPLLGITNILFLVDPTDNKVPAVVILYRVVNAFLQSSQGFAVAVIYCFTNQEVQAAVRKRWLRYVQTHSIRSRRRSAPATVAAQVTSDVRMFRLPLPSHRTAFVAPVPSQTSRTDRFAAEEAVELSFQAPSPYNYSGERGSSQTNSNSFHNGTSHNTRIFTV